MISNEDILKVLIDGGSSGTDQYWTFCLSNKDLLILVKGGDTGASEPAAMVPMSEYKSITIEIYSNTYTAHYFSDAIDPKTDDRFKNFSWAKKFLKGTFMTKYYAKLPVTEVCDIIRDIHSKYPLSKLP